MAIARVEARVAQGGHGVPETVIRRCFDSGLRNFSDMYRGMVSSWVLYDNSGAVPVRMEAGDTP